MLLIKVAAKYQLLHFSNFILSSTVTAAINLPMLNGIQSGQRQTSSFIFRLICITGYLGSYVIIDALVFPLSARIIFDSNRCLPSVSGIYFDGSKLRNGVKLDHNSPEASISLGPSSIFHLARQKYSSSRTSLFCAKTDSTFDDSESLSEEVQSALDMALGEVRLLF